VRLKPSPRVPISHLQWQTLENTLGTILLLEYPNGRRVETTLPAVVSAGDQFEMHGRRWQAVGELQPRRFRPGEPNRMVCRSLDRRAIDVINEPRD
jgi:hypothetical protein